MDRTPYKESYILQLGQLKAIIDITNGRMISDPPDTLIYENANFFSKAFLVTMCAYLESYLKDALMVVIDQMNARLQSAKLPHNLVKWSLNIDREIKDSEFKFEQLKIKIKKKQLDDYPVILLKQKNYLRNLELIWNKINYSIPKKKK